MNTSTISVLIVDDDPIDRQVYKRLLKQEIDYQFSFHEVDTAESAFSTLRNSIPDCLLLDYRLPDEDGIEFLSALKGLNIEHKIPIVMLTGQGSETVAVEAMKFGVHDYLVKSELTAGSLVNAVISAIKRTQLEKKLAEKQHDLEMFASIAAHDLKAPLKNIQYLSTKLSENEKVSQDNSSVKYFSELINNVERMQDLLNALISYTKTDKNEILKNQHSLNSVIDYVCKNIERLIAESSTTIKCNAGDTLLYVDKIAFAQLLQNLISNSIKYSEKLPVIEIDAQDDLDYKILTFRDNGIGFEPDFMESAFKAFKKYHQSEKHDGCGLGLATCHKIVERHGGRIFIESQQGVGSTFTIEIPKS